MKKRYFFLIFLVSGAGTLIFGLLWLNNLFSAWHYHLQLASGKTGQAVHGFLPSLDWSTIDVSTVTTLIPFFGFLLMLTSRFRSCEAENWPFFPGYDRLNIALGLIGTVWGIILVGYYPAEQMTIPALMSCLHTAMFSTLAAISWVMVILPLIFRPLLNRAKNELAGFSAGEEGDPEELLSRLTVNIASAGKELEGLAGSSKSFRSELEKIAGELKAGREAEAIWRTQVLETLRSFTAAAEVMQKQLENLSEENRTLAEEKKKAAAELELCKTELEVLRRRLESVKAALR